MSSTKEEQKKALRDSLNDEEDVYGPVKPKVKTKDGVGEQKEEKEPKQRSQEKQQALSKPTPEKKAPQSRESVDELFQKIEQLSETKRFQLLEKLRKSTVDSSRKIIIESRGKIGVNFEIHEELGSAIDRLKILMEKNNRNDVLLFVMDYFIQNALTNEEATQVLRPKQNRWQ
jgi:hypothetical protein